MYQLFVENWLLLLFVMIAFRAFFSRLYKDILVALNNQGQEPGQGVYFLGLFSKLKDVDQFNSLKVKMVDEASSIIFAVSLAFISYFALISIFNMAMIVVKGYLLVVLAIIVVNLMIGGGRVSIISKLIRF